MQHANARFERVQPQELKRVPFAVEELEMAPSFLEVIGWIFLAFFLGIVLVGFLGL